MAAHLARIIYMRKSIISDNRHIHNMGIMLVDFAAAIVFPHPGPWRRVQGGGAGSGTASRLVVRHPFHRLFRLSNRPPKVDWV
jgi:hypothetical protein